MPTYEISAPDGNKYRIEGPEGASQDQVIQEVLKQNPFAGQTTEELKKIPSAPSTLRDINETAAMSLAGGLKSLTDLFGVNNVVSKNLAEKQATALKQMTPARVRELQIEEELANRAEGKPLEEASTAGRAFLRSPLQGLTSGAFSTVPVVAATALAPEVTLPAALAGRLGTGAAGKIAQKIAGASPGMAVGTAMGVGSQKGQDYEAVKDAMLKNGATEEEAEAAAQKAAAYSRENAARQAASGVAGGAEAVLGVENVLGRMGRAGKAPATAPTRIGTAVKSTVGEAVPEAIQSVTGTVGTNIALQQAGFDRDLMAGVAGQATSDALTGAILGTAVSPLQYRSLQADFLRQQQEDIQKKQEKFEKQKEEFAKQHLAQQEKVKEQLGLNMLALPAPATTVEEKYRNPAATITKQEMGAEAAKYVDDYRKANNLPALKAYSIEDIKDAMPGLNPEGEKAILDSILAGKYGYKPVDETTGNEIKYTPADVLTLAEEQKNIATGTQGFKDFLTSVTGTDKVGEMSQPQLHAAYSALQKFEPSEETRILPEGTAATRFSQKQYDNALKVVNVEFASVDNKPLDPKVIAKEIKEATGLENDRDALALLDTAVKNGDLTFSTKPVFRVVDPATGQFVHTAATRAKAENYAKGKDLNIIGDSQSYISPAEQNTLPDRTPLPAGYKINQERVVEGEEDLVDVMREGKGQSLETIAADQAQARIDTLTGESKALAANALKRIERDSATVERIQKNLDQMVAKGEGKTRDFEIQKTRSEQTMTNLRRRIQNNLDTIEELSAPLKTRKSEVKKPIIKKKLTVTKEGKAIGTFSNKEIGKANAQAQDAILTQMTDEELQSAIDDKKLGLFSKKAKEEQDRRRGPTGFKITRAKTPETLSPQFVDQAEEIKKKLVPMLQKFGLGNVGLNIVNAIKNKAEGSYLNNLIQLAVDATNPVQTMRHEALHALKNLGFFTDSQWQALTNKAKTEWIQKYLKNQTAEFEGKTMSRFDAYKKMGLSDEEIAEEAIADAFGDFDANGSPPGMMAAILKRLNQLFEALKNAITGAGFQTADDIFGKIERGELKAAEAKPTETEKLALARPSSDIGHKREASTGRYVGAPDWVGDSPQRLTTLRKKLKKLAIEGEVGRYWYENSSQAVMDMTGNKKDAEKFVGLLAIYSAHSTVSANTSKALNAWYQYKTGQPINAGDTIQDKKAEELLRQDKYWSGIKTNSFYQNLMIEIDPSKVDPKTATMDMWMAIAFDYGSEKLDQGPKYGFALRETQRLANELGWTPHQTQAAIWTAIKGRVEATRDKIRAKDVERGNIEVSVGKNAKPVYILKPEGRYDHYRIAHQIGMDHKLTEQELLDSSYDFATALDERTAQVSWEATPGETTGLLPGLLKAPTNQKLEYLEAVSDVLRDKDGNDAIAVRIGLPAGKELLGFSAWKGDIGAGVQSFFPSSIEGVGERREARQEAKDLLNLYSNIRGFVLAQEAVVWHIPMFDGSKKNQNGYEGVFNQPLTEAEMKALYTGLHEKFATWEIAPGYTENGFRALNFTNVDNKTFQNGMREVLASMPKDFGGGQLEGLAFRSTGDYIGNDWETSPKGEDYARNIASAADPNRPAGSPDLQTWATDLRSRVETVNEEFSKKYNWGKPKLSLRAAPAEGKLSLRSTRQPPESKEFKQWFGNSYFTSGGEPLIMYHGTARDITIFKGKQAKAIFVTTKPDVAHTYADMGVDYMRVEAYQALTRDEKAELITVVAEQAERDGTITAKELKEIQSDLKKRVPAVDPEKKRIIGLPYQIEGEIIESLNNLLPTKGNIMPVYVNARNVFDYANKDDVNKVIGWMENNSRALGGMQNPEQWLKKIKDLISRGNWVRIESPEVQEAIRALDFDGFSVLEAGTKNYAVYNPTNIKSVTGNIGTFGLGEVTAEQAKQFGMTADQAKKAQEEGDIRFSLKSTLPADTVASIQKTTTVREEKGFAERMMDAISPKGFSSWRAEAVNRYNALGIVDKIMVQESGGAALYADRSAEAMALLSDDAAGVAAAAMGVHDRHGGIPVFRNGITTIDDSVEGILPIFAPLAKYKDPFVYQMYQFYSGAKRARRYLDKGIEKNYDANDIARANQLGKQYPEFEDIFKKWDKYNKGLVKYQVDTGVLSAAEGANYIKYADYVPFYRQLEGESTFGPNVFQSISGVKKPKKYKGGEAPIADFMETIVRNTQSAILAGMKNSAAKVAVDNFIAIKQAEAAPDDTTGKDVVHVLENGVKKSYFVFDPALVQAVMSLNLPDLPFIGFFAGPANLLRNLVTKDPGFMLANMVRDSMSAWVTSGVNMTPVASAAKNFVGALRGTSPEYKALLNAGILGGYEYSQGVEVSAANMKKALGRYEPATGLNKLKSAPRSLWEALEKGTMASDAATRMEVYKNVLAETGNEAEALFRAQEVMNFQRKGRSAVVRVLTAGIPFLNARIQGLDVLYRSMSGQMGTADAAKIQKAFFVRGASIMAISMMYWFLTHDDDEYKKQEQETRDNNWLIPSLGIKLPIPFEVGVIFKVIPERIAEYFFGNDTGKDFADSMKRNFMSTFAFNLIPQVGLPLYEAATNHSFFTGRNIVGAGLEGVAPEYQVGPNTSQLAAWLGSQTGYSPMLIDHVIGGYTGTFGSYAVDVVDSIAFANSDVQRPSKRFEQLPIFKRFLLDPQAKGDVTAYYDLKNSVDEAVRTSNFLEKTSNFEEMGKYSEETLRVLASKDFISDMEKDMKDYREFATYVRTSTMSPDDKRDMLRSITDAENAMTANIRYLRKLMD